jgi:acyl carrier protein
MPNDLILQRLRQLSCAALNLNLSPEETAALSRLDEVAGFDSLTVLNFVSAVEKEFDVTLTGAELTTELLVDLPRLAARIASLERKSC